MAGCDISLLADHPRCTAALARLYHDEWGALLPGVGVEQIGAHIERAANRDAVPLIVLAHVDGRLAGAAELKFRENPDFPEYEHWMGGVIVDPDLRGSGISQLLVEGVKGHAKRLGVARLYLQCEAPLVPLYERRGFVAVRDATHRGLAVVIMVWVVGADDRTENPASPAPRDTRRAPRT